MLLSNSDIAWMRDTQEMALPGTVVIERVTLTVDGMGGFYEAWAAVGTAIGRIYPRTQTKAGETVEGAQLLSMTTWYGTLPVGTDVTAKDRLLYSGRTWEVIRVNNDEMWKTVVRCELESHNEERRA